MGFIVPEGNTLEELHMTLNCFIKATACLAVLSLPACMTAGKAAIGTVATAGNVAIKTAGTAGQVAIKTAGMTQSVAQAAATGAANGAGREGGKLAVRGLAAAGQAGFRAMMADDSSISEETLAHRAGLTLSYPREDLAVGNVYEEGDRTDYTVISLEGEAANCYVLRTRGTVGDATCQPAGE